MKNAAPAVRQFHIESQTASDRLLSHVERLRNDLAHANSIVPQGWDVIVRFCLGMDRFFAFLDTHAGRD